MRFRIQENFDLGVFLGACLENGVRLVVETEGESVDGSFVVQDSFLSILGVSDEIKATIVRDMATAQGSVEV